MKSNQVDEGLYQAMSQRAHSIVSQAVKDGKLPDLKKVKTKCSDCEKRAVHHDHRDYARPLEVSPVCRGCNRKRGSAVCSSVAPGLKPIEVTVSARVSTGVLNQYRRWANLTGRNITDLMNIALLFALRKQSEVEREVAQKLEPKS
jgi:hypothetical protein